MKRLITFICLIIIIFVGCHLIKKGLENSVFNVSSYGTIETKSEALTRKLALYDKKNQDDYGAAINNLNTSVKAYDDSKEKYDAIFAELADVIENNDEDNEAIEEIIYSDKEKYKVDFLLVTLGGYGESEGVDVIYQVMSSSTIDPNASTLSYFLANLRFTVTGQYIDVTNFISDLENDEKLNWEINDFIMESGNSNGYSGVTAVFTVRNVPIDSESFLASDEVTTVADATIRETNTSNSNRSQTSNQNTTRSTTNTVSNTVTNTVANTAAAANSNSTANTTANTVSNSTVN